MFFVFLVINACNHGEYYKTPCIIKPLNITLDVLSRIFIVSFGPAENLSGKSATMTFLCRVTALICKST